MVIYNLIGWCGGSGDHIDEFGWDGDEWVGMSGTDARRDKIGGGFRILVADLGIRQWLYF